MSPTAAVHKKLAKNPDGLMKLEYFETKQLRRHLGENLESREQVRSEINMIV